MLTATTSSPSSPTISRPRPRPSSRTSTSVALSPSLRAQHSSSSSSSPRCVRGSLSPPTSALTATVPAQPATVDAGTQYSPLGYPPTVRRASRAVQSEISSSSSSSNSNTSNSNNNNNNNNNDIARARGKQREHHHYQHPKHQHRVKETTTTAATTSGPAGLPSGPASKPAHDAAAAESGTSTAAVGTTAAVATAAGPAGGAKPAAGAAAASSSSSSTSSSARSVLPSSPKRSRLQMDEPAKVMPLKYETCDVNDLGLLIADMLNELVRLNDDIPLKDGQLTRFHSRAPPGISVKDYLSRLIVHATLSPPILLSMVYYIDRLCALYPAFTISSLTVHRFLITAATVAAKGLGDSFWTNSTYARVGGVSVRELALLELEFLGRLEWRIVPKPEVLVDYYRSLVERSGGYTLEKEQAVGGEAERMDTGSEGS